MFILKVDVVGIGLRLSLYRLIFFWHSLWLVDLLVDLSVDMWEQRQHQKRLIFFNLKFCFVFFPVIQSFICFVIFFLYILNSKKNKKSLFNQIFLLCVFLFFSHFSPFQFSIFISIYRLFFIHTHTHMLLVVYGLSFFFLYFATLNNNKTQLYSFKICRLWCFWKLSTKNITITFKFIVNDIHYKTIPSSSSSSAARKKQSNRPVYICWLL